MFDDKTILDIKRAIVREFNADDVKHNHPPLSFVVMSCPYCQKYGNSLA